MCVYFVYLSDMTLARRDRSKNRIYIQQSGLPRNILPRNIYISRPIFERGTRTFSARAHVPKYPAAKIELARIALASTEAQHTSLRDAISLEEKKRKKKQKRKRTRKRSLDALPRADLDLSDLYLDEQTRQQQRTRSRERMYSFVNKFYTLINPFDFLIRPPLYRAHIVTHALCTH